MQYLIHVVADFIKLILTKLACFFTAVRTTRLPVIPGHLPLCLSQCAVSYGRLAWSLITLSQALQVTRSMDTFFVYSSLSRAAFRVTTLVFNPRDFEAFAFFLAAFADLSVEYPVSGSSSSPSDWYFRFVL